MQTAHHAANSALSSRSSKPSGSAASAKPPARRVPLNPMLPTDLLDFVWLRMAARYGHAWVSQYGARPEGAVAAEWRETLGPLTQAQLNAGFQTDAQRGADWPPSSGSFRRACLGIPPLAQVRAECRPGCPAISRFTRGVMAVIDSFALRQATAVRAERMLAEGYDLTVAAVMRGEELPAEPVGVLGYEVDARDAHYTPEVGAEALRGLEREIGPA